MILNKFDIGVWKKYFGNVKVKKGIYQSDVHYNGTRLAVIDNFNNIVNIFTSNIEVLIGYEKSQKLYKEIGLEKEVKNYNKDEVLYLKCDELKLVSGTTQGMYKKLDKIIPQKRSLTTFTKLVKRNKSKFLFRGYLIEIIRESDIYKGDN